MKQSFFKSILPGIMILLTFVFSLRTFSQRHPLLDITHTMAIDPVTHEQVVRITTKNTLEDIIRFSPETHHINSRITTIDYDDPQVDKTIIKSYYDANNFPSYIQSVTVDNSSHPIDATEQVYDGPVVMKGYKWINYKGIAKAELYDEVAKKYKPTDLTATYKQMLAYNPPSLSQIKPMNHSVWDSEVKSIFAKGDNIKETTPGDIYGGNEETSYMSDGPNKIQERNLYDSHGTLRKNVYREYYSDDWEYEEVTYYDCDGTIIYKEDTWYDDDDYPVEEIDIPYHNGKPIGYFRSVDDYDAHFREFFDPLSGRFRYVHEENEEYSNFLWNTAMENADEPCDDFPYNDFFFGAALIMEDSYGNHFNTIGAEVTYTRYFCKGFGLSGDVSVTYGSQYTTDYTKISVMAGPTWLPFKNSMGLKDEFTLSLHAWVGIASVTGKTTFNNTNFKSTSTNLSGELGVNGSYNFSKNWGIEAGAGWNLVFSSGSTSNNYRTRLGLKYDF